MPCLWVLITVSLCFLAFQNTSLPSPKAYLSVVEPIAYHLFLNVTLSEYTFTGKVSITLNLLNQTNLLQIPYTGESVGHVEFGPVNGQKLIPDSVHHHSGKLQISFQETLEPTQNPYMLSLLFSGSISTTDTFGFYASHYALENGTTQTMAISHFEPDGARSVFPCFDEPALKAIFDIAVEVEQPYSVISNTPLRERLGDTRKKFIFDQTPRMSTYLLAWSISTLESISAKNTSGRLLRVFHPPNRAPDAR